MFYKSLSIILLSSLIVISCSPVKKVTLGNTTTGEGIELKGVHWKLVSFENDITPLKYNIHFQLSEDSNRMYGQGTCNTINGTYSLEIKYKISFQNLIMSWKACNDDGYEKRYLELLRKANRYKLEDGKLLLYNEQKKLAVFIKTARE
jgi:copper homeostasis protein (lipoprotein)